MVAAGDREAGPLGLGDADGLLRGAQRAGELRIGVVAVLGRNRDGADVQHLRHFLAHDVDVGHQPVDRVRPGAVLGEVLHEGQAAQDPAALFLRVLEDAGGQRGNADLADVQTAAGEGLEPALVRGQELFDDLEFLLQHRELAGRRRVQLDGGNHRAAGDRNGHIRRPSPCGIVQEDPEPPVLTFGRRVPGGVQQTEVRDAPGLRPAVPRHAGCPGPR